MYTLTIFSLIAIAVAIFFAIIIPTFKKQMRAVPGPGENPADNWQRGPLPPVKHEREVPRTMDDPPKQP